MLILSTVYYGCNRNEYGWASMKLSPLVVPGKVYNCRFNIWFLRIFHTDFCSGCSVIPTIMNDVSLFSTSPLALDVKLIFWKKWPLYQKLIVDWIWSQSKPHFILHRNKRKPILKTLYS